MEFARITRILKMSPLDRGAKHWQIHPRMSNVDQLAQKVLHARINLPVLAEHYSTAVDRARLHMQELIQQAVAAEAEHGPSMTPIQSLALTEAKKHFQSRVSELASDTAIAKANEERAELVRRLASESGTAAPLLLDCCDRLNEVSGDPSVADNAREIIEAVVFNVACTVTLDANDVDEQLALDSDKRLATRNAVIERVIELLGFTWRPANT